jgi:hypothetical protein
MDFLDRLVVRQLGPVGLAPRHRPRFESTARLAEEAESLQQLSGEDEPATERPAERHIPQSPVDDFDRDSQDERHAPTRTGHGDTSLPGSSASHERTLGPLERRRSRHLTKPAQQPREDGEKEESGYAGDPVRKLRERTAVPWKARAEPGSARSTRAGGEAGAREAPPPALSHWADHQPDFDRVRPVRLAPSVPVPDIVVHIGRIDVRGNSQPRPEPVTPPGLRQPELSLENYLNRRHGATSA